MKLIFSLPDNIFILYVITIITNQMPCLSIFICDASLLGLDANGSGLTLMSSSLPTPLILDFIVWQ